MRLIDADAWKADIDENYVFTGFKELREDVIQSIDAQPTVDAIPVKWWEDLIDLYRVANPSFNEDVDLIEEFLEDWREQNALN